MNQTCPKPWVQAVRFIALTLNTALLMPCACVMWIGSMADVGIHESQRALAAGVILGCTGACSVTALLLASQGKLYEIARWIAIAANVLMVIVVPSVLICYYDSYPFYGNVIEFSINIGVAEFTALALWLRRPTAQEPDERLSGM